MTEKTSTIPPDFGENPSLSAEELEALKVRDGIATKAEDIGDITALTAQLLEKNIAEGGIAIQPDEISAAPRPSMSPERLKRTNRPPDGEVYSDVVRALAKAKKKDGTTDEASPETEKSVYCVEQDDEK